MNDKDKFKFGELQSKLLKSILTMQSDFIERGIDYGWCMGTLENLLILSDSQFGFICELLEKNDGTPYIKSHAIANIAWNEETRQFYEENKRKGLEFFNFDSLWGKAITTGHPVIANDPDNDERRGGYPKASGHPALESFLAIPIKGSKGKVVGVMSVANRPDGYDNEVVEFLSPFVTSYGVLIEKYRTEEELEHRQRTIQHYLDVARVMMLALDVEGKVTLINPEGCRILGRERDEIIGHNWFQEFLDNSEIEEVKSVFNRIISGDIEPVQYYENAVVRKDGHKRLIAWHNSMLYDAVGNMVGLFSSGEDITERRMAESELKREREFLSKAQEIGKIGTWELDIENNKLFWTDENYRIFGLPIGTELTYDIFLNCVHPDDREYVDKQWKAAFDKKPYDIEHRILIDGEVKWVREKAELEFNEKGEAIRAVGVAQDITERKIADKAIQDSEKRSRALVDHSPACHKIIDLDFNLQYMSANGFQMLKLEENDERYGKPYPFDFFPEPAREVLSTGLSRVKESGKATSFESAACDAEGNRVWLHHTVIPVFEEDGPLSFITVVSADITERKLAEEELRRYEWLQEKEESTPSSYHEEYRPNYRAPVELNTSRVILDAVGKETLELMARDVLILLDTSLAVYEANGDYAYGAFNSAWCQSMDNASFRLCGRNDTREALASGKWLCHENCWNDSAVAALESGEPTDIPCVGGIRLYAVPVRAGDKFIGVVNIGYSSPPKDDKTLNELAEKYKIDADHLRELSGQYKPRPEFIINVAKSRCESMAQMIGQLVERHRFELEKEKLQEQLLQSQKMESIGRLAGGIAHDFNNLLTAIQGFSDLAQSSLRAGDPVKKDVAEIQKAADSAAALTNQLLAFSRKQIISPKVIDLNRVISQSKTMLRRMIGEDIDLLFVPDESIGKVLFDTGQMDQILVNLSVNSRDAMPGGGKFTIETKSVSLEEKECQSCGDPIVGDFVMLAATDNGIGMDSKTTEKIFEPFFTTREKGSGLGLSTVHGIVHQHNGHINVYSEPQKGTTFKLYFPVVQDQAESIQKGEESVDARGSETILLVEDQPVIRRLARRVLMSNGYKVIEAEDGREALSKYEEMDGQIDLLVTDVVMPTMGGKKLYEELIKFDPKLEVLYMSGYTENSIAHHGVLEESTNFIQKPYKPKELAEKVRRVLDAHEGKDPR